ncbi:hypothetical protein [Clostridium tagluense]|uniref:hypothetical protein n=1 Tax=Clostridium tagluense TaxID=360422 RepID=UPI001C0C87BC|nr:hypothetical protein [Clostridium tagluense]MBU3128488.1 hypothetical protein [Clostridium tagluense]
MKNADRNQDIVVHNINKVALMKSIALADSNYEEILINGIAKLYSGHRKYIKDKYETIKIKYNFKKIIQLYNIVLYMRRMSICAMIKYKELSY